MARIPPGAWETLPGAALTPPFPPRSLPAPGPSPAPPHSAQHTTLAPFPTRPPARPPARPAGRWCCSALPARRAPPPALSAQAGWRGEAGSGGRGEPGRPVARPPALTRLRRLARPGPRPGPPLPSRGHPTAAPSLAPAVASRLLRSLALAPNRPQQRPAYLPPRPLRERRNAPNQRPSGSCRLTNRRSRL